jgi:hypothetical protein
VGPPITATDGGIISATGTTTKVLAEIRSTGKSHIDSACLAQAADRLVMAQTPPFSCNGCKDGTEQPFPFSMAFRPIVDVNTGKVFAYEALVPGERGESAGSIPFESLPRFTLPNVRLDAIGVGEGNRISTPVAADPLGSAVAKTLDILLQ